MWMDTIAEKRTRDRVLSVGRVIDGKDYPQGTQNGLRMEFREALHEKAEGFDFRGLDELDLVAAPEILLEQVVERLEQIVDCVGTPAEDVLNSEARAS